MKKADQSCKKKLWTIYPALLMLLGLSCDYLTPQTIHAAASQGITYETNKNTKNIFTPQVDGKPFSNLIDFFDAIKQSPDASSGFFEQILNNYKANGQKHFNFEARKDKQGFLCFKLEYCDSKSTDIDPMADYDPNSDDYVKGFQEHIKFQKSVQDNEKDPLQPLFVPTNDRVKFYRDYSQKTPYSRWKNFNDFVVFSSTLEGRLIRTTLVVPKTGYTSVLKFAINATEEEKKDAITTLSKILTDVKGAGLSADFGIHTGGGAGQSVAHLHFRVTIEGEPTFDQLEQKFTELEEKKVQQSQQEQVATSSPYQQNPASVSGASTGSAAASSSSSGTGTTGATGGSAKGKKKASTSKTSVSKRTSKTTGRKKFKKSRIKKRLKSRKRTKRSKK